MYNLEATPAEGTTDRFAKDDRKRFPDILQARTEANPYYTDSSQLPVGFTDDSFEALDRQDELQSKYTGGTVLHLYMSEKLCMAAAWRELVQRSLTTHRLPYITVTPSFSICPDHGYLAGEHPTCTVCGGVCEVWTIVMGHFRPVSSFSIGKKGERERSADRGTCGTVHLRLAAGQASRPTRRGGLLGWGAHPARTTVDPMIMPPGEVRGSAPRSPPWACGNTCCRLCGPKVPAPRSRRG